MKSRVKIFQIIIVVLIAFFGGYYFGVNKVALDWKNYNPILNVVGKEPPSGLITVDFNPFWTVWQKLETSYYDKSKLDQQKMLNGAITGMIGALGDQFTMYLPPVQNSNFKQGLAGQFSGIGAELATKDKDIIVIAPLDGSPAEKAGIKAGDVVLKVNSQSVVGMDLSKVVDQIRGPKGSNVVLTVLHKDTQKQTDLTITRDVITVKSVVMNIANAKCTTAGCSLVAKGDSCTDSACVKYAYIRLSQFGDNTNTEWDNLVKGISDSINKDKSIKGIVFDLRNNPGGYLTDAQHIAGTFLPKDALVVTEDTGTTKIPLTVEKSGLLIQPKLVVLINGGSASASEIVAGALRDDRKIELVGDKSFGKGTVQEADDLGDGAGLHVTIAKWLTPNGTWVHGKGLAPDVSVLLNPKDPSRDTQLEKAVSELLK
jgi:carboxyl-terminal processing protease